jgi:hypothetical protein
MELTRLNVRRLASLLRARIISQEALGVLGRVLNRFRCPGFVQQTAYTYRTSKGVQVEVMVLTVPRYTVVTVNGIDIYFDRLSGVIDRPRTVGPSAEKPARKNAVDRFPGTRAA